MSYECPCIHPMFTIPTTASNHTPSFADAAKPPESYERALACGKGLAAVAIKVLTDEAFAEEVWRDFEDGKVVREVGMGMG